MFPLTQIAPMYLKIIVGFKSKNTWFTYDLRTALKHHLSVVPREQGIVGFLHAFHLKTLFIEQVSRQDNVYS